MTAKTIKEDYFGVDVFCYSIEMLALEPIGFEIVMRMPLDNNSRRVEPPKRVIERYKNRAEAEFRYHQAFSLMIKIAPRYRAA